MADSESATPQAPAQPADADPGSEDLPNMIPGPRAMESDNTTAQESPTPSSPNTSPMHRPIPPPVGSVALKPMSFTTKSKVQAQSESDFEAAASTENARAVDGDLDALDDAAIKLYGILQPVRKGVAAISLFCWRDIVLVETFY